MRTLCVAVGVAAVLANGAVALAQPAIGPETPGWFPFTLDPSRVAADSPADVSFLSAGPASRRITVRDGHFVDDRGQRVRFIGTNATFSAAFPEKEQAPAIAARMAQLGINVVRFHHLDARDIWLPGQKALDPAKLDRLDWFVHQLKQHGIYTNLNLHVSRTYPGLEALKDARAFRYGKVLDMFYPPFIDLQEQYARDLLDRTNPYTGLKLSQDPAIAFVELNNENTLLAMGPNELAELAAAPELSESLRGQWAAWLARRHPDLAATLAAWNAGAQPLGDEMLTNPRFEGDLSEWTLEGTAPGVCEMAADAGGGVRVVMSAPGKVAWAYQVHQVGLTFTEGATYTIHFRGRAEPARRISVGLRLAEPPWTVLSGSHDVTLTPEWSEHTVVCQVRGVPEALKKRFSLNLGDQVGQVWLADASLRPGREPYRLPGVQALAAIPLPGATAPDLCRADFRRFLIDTERAYMKRLKGFLKETLGVKSLVVNSQASYGGYYGLWRESELGDYVDMHAYWQHPHFPRKPWDSNDWTIGNTSMVSAADGGNFARLSAYRYAGLPFTVSEYNHPAPNDHAAELFPLICSFGALQDWDAIYQFTYANGSTTYGPGKIGGYFELCHHPGQVVFAPLAAVLFRQGLVAPAAAALTIDVPPAALEARLAESFPGPDAILDRERLPLWARLSNRFGVRTGPGVTGSETRFPAVGGAPAEGVLLDSAHVRWLSGERPLFTVVSPGARVAVGRLGGQAVALGNITLNIGLPEGRWACAMLVATDGKPVAESARLLLAVVTRTENSGMVWDEARRSVGRNWGKEPVMMEAVPFTLDGPGTAPRVSALDACGQRGEALAIAAAAAGWRLTVPASTRSPWYALERP